MTKEEIEELRLELGSQNKDWIMKFFYNPIAKFLMLNETKYSGKISKLGIGNIRKLPTKDDMIGLVYKMYADEEIAKGFVASHNERDRSIINTAVWKGGLDRAALEILFEKKIILRAGESYYTRLDLIPEVKSAWGDYTTILDPNGYYGNPDLYEARSNVSLSFPTLLRKLLAIHLPKPAGFNFEPIPEPGSDFKIYLTENVIFSELPRIIAYHGQGNLKYSQKGNPNLASAKKMSKTLKTLEFGRDTDFPTRSLLVSGLLSESFKMKVITDPAEKIILKLFATNFNKYPTAPYLLTHLKGLNYFYSYDFEAGTTETIFSAVRQLPQEKWITFENVQNFVNGRFWDILPLSDWLLRQKIQAEYELDEKGSTQKQTVPLHRGNTQQFVWRPYLAGHIYLLAAFGLMDIAIDPAIQNTYTPYDNLHALRLTKLGAYVLGLNKEYIPPARDSTTTLTFDENSPIIRIEGDVVLGDTLLANYASRVSENRYQFSHGKFLKECKTTKDIQNKIALFKQTVGQKLPPFWEDYLQELITNSKSVSLQTSVRVFTIPAENKVLQRIVVQDDVLRKLVIKAEQFHILVAETNISVFTNRMKELGYVIG